MTDPNLYLHLDRPDERVRLHSAECAGSDDPEADALLYGQVAALIVALTGLVAAVLWVGGWIG